MKRHPVILFALLLALTGCQQQGKTPAPKEPVTEQVPTVQTIQEQDDSAASAELGSRSVSLSGPYGTLELTIPEAWDFQLLAPDTEDDLRATLYGIRFSPAGSSGSVEVGYCNSFGVCGTGLVEEETTLAGQRAVMGTYDDHGYWDFVAWHGDLEGVVALQDENAGKGWTQEEHQSAQAILDTVSFHREQRSGCIGVSSQTADAASIGLYLHLKNVTPTGATLVWNFYDPELPTGELQYGDSFTLEQQDGEAWVSLPCAVENAGFNDIAHFISTDGENTLALDWSWLYGELSPGTYRLCKQVMDFRSSGDYDTYELRAVFLVN